MRKMLSLFVSVACMLFASTVLANDASTQVRGIYLLTNYPAITARPGTTSTISLTLRNHGVTPTRMQLPVENVSNGWTATFLRGGQQVAAAMPCTAPPVGLAFGLE